MDKPKMALSDWQAEAYTRYLTKKGRSSLNKLIEEWLKKWIKEDRKYV